MKYENFPSYNIYYYHASLERKKKYFPLLLI
jgi:hypothetical protein